MADRSAHRLQIDVVRGSEEVTVVVMGDLDRLSASRLRDVGIDLIDTSPRLSVDLVGASVIDSSALKVLIELHRAAGVADRGFGVIIGAPSQRTLFTTTGLDDYFELIHRP